MSEYDISVHDEANLIFDSNDGVGNIDRTPSFSNTYTATNTAGSPALLDYITDLQVSQKADVIPFQYTPFWDPFDQSSSDLKHMSSNLSSFKYLLQKMKPIDLNSLAEHLAIYLEGLDVKAIKPSANFRKDPYSRTMWLHSRGTKQYLKHEFSHIPLKGYSLQISGSCDIIPLVNYDFLTSVTVFNLPSSITTKTLTKLELLSAMPKSFLIRDFKKSKVDVHSEWPQSYSNHFDFFMHFFKVSEQKYLSDLALEISNSTDSLESNIRTNHRLVILDKELDFNNTKLVESFAGLYASCEQHCGIYLDTSSEQQALPVLIIKHNLPTLVYEIIRGIKLVAGHVTARDFYRSRLFASLKEFSSAVVNAMAMSIVKKLSNSPVTELTLKSKMYTTTLYSEKDTKSQESSVFIQHRHTQFPAYKETYYMFSDLYLIHNKDHVFLDCGSGRSYRNITTNTVATGIKKDWTNEHVNSICASLPVFMKHDCLLELEAEKPTAMEDNMFLERTVVDYVTETTFLVGATSKLATLPKSFYNRHPFAWHSNITTSALSTFNPRLSQEYVPFRNFKKSLYEDFAHHPHMIIHKLLPACVVVSPADVLLDFKEDYSTLFFNRVQLYLETNRAIKACADVGPARVPINMSHYLFKLFMKYYATAARFALYHQPQDLVDIYQGEDGFLLKDVIIKQYAANTIVIAMNWMYLTIHVIHQGNLVE
jgi:hypothetical protein